MKPLQSFFSHIMAAINNFYTNLKNLSQYEYFKMSLIELSKDKIRMLKRGKKHLHRLVNIKHTSIAY